MIRYRLVCGDGHEFEGWFRNSAAFDEQAARGQVTCPHCGAETVSKAIMAPAVSPRAGGISEAVSEPASEGASEVRALMLKLRTTLEQSADYVGPRFAEEARKVHYKEGPPRGVYGEASPEEVKSLIDEGIAVLPLPRLREDLN